MTPSSRYRPLPRAVQRLLEQYAAPPRLVAHLTLTHEGAARLIPGLKERWPDLAFDESVVLFGAAIHDLGKTAHPEELRQSGNLHEAAGERLLLAAGVSPELARFCRTHGTWSTESPLEDLLVALADQVWKGKRDEPLEEAIVVRISEATGHPHWKVFVDFDELATELTEGAEERLRWQQNFPV